MHSDTIYCMCGSQDSRTIFISDSQGRVTQRSIFDMSLIKDYGKAMEGVIFDMTCIEYDSGPSEDRGFYLMVSDSKGNMKQIETSEDMEVV